MTTLGQCLEGPDLPPPPPPRLEVVSERKLYNSGADDFFSYASRGDGSASIAKVISGQIRGVELGLKGGQTIVVSRVDGAVTVQNKDPFMRPSGPALSAVTIADIVQNARMLALAKLVMDRGHLDEIEAIDAGFDPHEIEAYRKGMAQAGRLIQDDPDDVKTAQAHAAALEDCLAHALIENQILRGRRDELLDANNRYQQEARDARAEVLALRRIVSDTAGILGAHISPTASIDFMNLLLREARLKIELNSQTIGAYQARERSVYEQLSAYGVSQTPTLAQGVNTLGQRLRRAADAALAAGCVQSSDGGSWVVPTFITGQPGTQYTMGSWETPEGGIIRLERWPDDEGYVLWYHGQIAWRSNPNGERVPTPSRA